MAEEKDGEVLPLTEYDDCTHWVGKLDKYDKQKCDTDKRILEENPKRERRFGMGGLFR